MRKSLLVFAIAALMCAGPVAAKKKFVCWNDDKGQKMCGDSVPPQYAKQEQQIRNERGVVVDTRARERTAEERVADELAAKQSADARQREIDQAKYDKYLMQTYQKVSDLEVMRKERVATLEARLVLAEKSVVDAQTSVKTLHERVEGLKKNKKEPDKRLAAQIKEYDKALVENLQSVAALKQEREKTIAKFDTDIARYNELRPAAP